MKNQLKKVFFKSVFNRHQNQLCQCARAQSDDIGRNVIDNFETAMRRRKATKGIIIAFSFGKGAYEEIARARLHDNLEIKALTVTELLKNQRQNKL